MPSVTSVAPGARGDKPSADIAGQLESMVGEIESNMDPSRYELPKTVHQQYRYKTHPYAEAVVLMALISKTEEDQRYGTVREHFETAVFGRQRTKAAWEKLEAVRNAMANLAELRQFVREDHVSAFRWGKDWMSSIGHSERNPIRLVMFAIAWLDAYVAVTRTLDDLQSM